MRLLGFLKKDGNDYDTLVSKMKVWEKKYFVDNGSRTSERQKAILAMILRLPDHDLYKMSAHGTTCAFCAAREGRVYSRSGKDPDFPPLALAFEKIDKNGPAVLWNTYLIPHPNCIHSFTAWTPMGRSDAEIKEIKRFSSIKLNPLSRDPRTQKQREVYEQKEVNRRQRLADYKLFERCSACRIEKFPKTFDTFLKHKKENSEKYQLWMKQYHEKKEKKGGPPCGC